MPIPLITETSFLHQLQSIQNPFFNDYFAYYSSWFGGITKDPRLMLLPLDDHMVHRGDGVFEACKAINKSIYLFDQHLERLYHSAELIHLAPRFSLGETRSIILETLKVADRDSVAVRIYISRGPGNFTVNPYDSIGSQLYVAITALKKVSVDTFKKGVKIGFSKIPVKTSWMAQVKSCNYLPNVLMKKEAIDRNLDFVVSIDEKGCIGEGATENIMMIESTGKLIYPRFKYTLKGTTLVRALELAKQEGFITEEKEITVEDLLKAKEVMMTGTTLDILPVIEIEGQGINDGKPGPLAHRLCQLLIEDQKNNKHY